MEIRGMPQGMAPFLIQIGGETQRPDGYSGSLSDKYPTFWIVGGTVADAIQNAVEMLGLKTRPDVTRIVVHAAYAGYDRWYAGVYRWTRGEGGTYKDLSED